MAHARAFLCLILIFWATKPANAWDYERHRLINGLALKSLPKEFPRFVLLPTNLERVKFLAGEPDRWRNTRDRGLRHLNNPDHYFDVEYLELYHIKTETLSHFRYRFVEQMANARSKLKLELPEANADHIKNYPGFLPWSINEHYLKLLSAFSYLKVFEEMGTQQEIKNAQANVIYRMGILSHFVGDTSQPLHTTKHFNGWTGDNPNDYTTRRSFHSWIDGKFFINTQPPNEVKLQKQLRPAKLLIRPESKELASGHFQASLNYILKQHELVVPLYQLDKDGHLSEDSPDKGRLFLEKQLLVGAQMLGDLWFTAWKEAPPDRFLQGYLAKRKLNNK
ncbi:MAG: hypothetical protein QF406_10040 [Verrucomicrobiota bacterium]|nr:hypothetical protein [Verrucomicrobiota bacterium]